MTEIDNPFDGEAAAHIREQGAPEQAARDCVVLRYLAVGDTRALAHWIEQDYCPGPAVRRLLSYMLQPVRGDPDDPKKTFTCDYDKVPYELKAVRRSGGKGRKPDLAAAERNSAIMDRYRRLLEEYGPGASDGAVKTLAEELEPEISESMIREAIKSRSPKSRS